MEDFYSYNMQQVIQELNDKKQELNTNGKTIVYLIILFLIGLGLFLQVSVIPIKTEYILITLATTIVLIIGAFLIKNAVVHSILKNTYLNREVIKLYNYEKEINAEYYPKYKTGSDFNKSMGLFTRFSSVSNKYMIKLDEQTRVLNTVIQTNNGKSNQIHFQGIYIMIEQPEYTMFQVRTNGKPHLKGHSFIKEPIEDIKVYRLENEDIIRFNYRSVLNRLEEYKKVYIASNRKAVHIAFNPFKPKFNHKEITHENFKEYYHQFESLLNTILQIKDIVLMVNT